ncbi:uncharacterized protein LOC121062133 [Cygnus olor]|uniref:uncharacterized protein LOC121062133 n=2 Tax=Cygnus olor TaxID=8869 RepID=UPI001ADE6394|nr:uncharacterized protein LOC121062133 [Cygnus olor]
MTGLLGLCFARCGGQGWGLGCTGQPCDAEPRLGHGLGPPRAAVVTMVLWCPQQNWDESAWGLSPGLCDAVRFRPSTMAIGIIHLLSVLGLLQLTLKVGDQPDKVTQDLIQEQEKMLREEMSWLLQEVKEGSELESGNSTPFVFLAACHHWQFWALAEVLLILFGMYWLPRQRKADTNGDSDPWSSTSEDGDVGEEEDEKVEDELMEEQEEWEEVHFNDQRDPGLLVGLLREAVLPKLLEMENIMEEMAGTNSASANSLQRSTFMSELQAEMGLFATLFENNLAISSLICSKDQLNGSPSSFH